MKPSLTDPVRPSRADRKGERRQNDLGPPSGVERRVHDGDRRVENNVEYVSFSVANQLLGISVTQVREVLPPQPITRVPLAPPYVAGLLNLRGQIITAVDLRCRLGLPPRGPDESFMNIIVEDGDELFSLVADSVGDVIAVAMEKFADAPPTLDETWKRCCDGVFRLQKGLLVVVNIPAILATQQEK